MNKIWCLELSNIKERMQMLYYDLDTKSVKKTNLNYPFTVFFLCDRAYKSYVVDLVMELFQDEVAEIINTTIPFKCIANNLMDMLTQFNLSENIYRYDLLAITTITMSSCQRVFNFFRENAQLKTSIFLLNNTSLSFMICLHNMIQNLSTIKYQNDNSLVLENKYQYREFNYPSKSIQNETFLERYFDFSSYFLMNAIFNITASNQLELITIDTGELYRLLPMIAFDIETSAKTMTDFPLGGNQYEKITSLTLFGIFDKKLVVVVLYLRFFQVHAQTDVYWNNMDKKLTMETVNYYSAKYPDFKVHAAILSFATESSLLKSFYEWYSRGLMLNLLCGDKNMVHFFTGHNIIKYDLNFMLTRFKWHSLHDYVDDIVTFNSIVDQDYVIIKFHPRAVILDSLIVFKQHSLGGGYSLSLKNLSNLYVADVASKFDLNSILIRYYYIIDSETATYSTSCKNQLGMLLKANSDVSFANANSPPPTITFDISSLPNVIKSRLTTGATNINTINVYKISHIIQYNIIDCEVVVALWNKFSYGNLLSDTIKQYPLDSIELAMHGNVSKRMHALFTFYAINYAQQIVIPATIDLNKSRAHINTNYFIEEYNLLYSSNLRKISTNPVDNNDNANMLAFKQSLCEDSYSSVERLEHLTTKKKYAGAAVFYSKIFVKNTCQCDVVSMYPNIIIGKKLNTDSVDMVSAGVLKSLLTKDKNRTFFQKLINNDMLCMFIAEDESTNYISYLHNFSHNFNAIVGTMIIDITEIFDMNNTTPIIIKFYKTDVFINVHLRKILKRRKEIQKRIKDKKYAHKRAVYDSRQRSIKTAVNSLYGRYGNTNVPVAAATTLYGRKILMFAAKMTYFIVLCTLQKLYAQAFNCVWLEGYKYDKLQRTLAAIDSELPKDFCTHTLKDSFLLNLKRRILMDGTDSCVEFKILRNHVTTCSDDLQAIFDALPGVIVNLVYDGDTDGFQFQNIFHLDTAFICEKLNAIVCETLHTENILFEDTTSMATMCLGKKRYITYTYMPEISALKFNDCKIKHSGYERNALPCIKKCCKYISVLCYYMRFGQMFQHISFDDVIFSVFHYLHECVGPMELYVNVAFKKLANNSARRRFIEGLTTSYRGNVNAVFLYNYSTNEEQYCTLQEYSQNHSKYTLNYAHFLRSYSQVWYNQFNIAKQCIVDEKKKVPDLINDLFSRWVQNKNVTFNLLDIQNSVLPDK